MPFEVIQNDEWIGKFRRVLIYSGPNNWKTSSLVTFPHSTDEGLLAIVQCPGELGGSSSPQSPLIKNFQFKDDPTRSAHTAVRETKQLVIDLIAGKHGKINVLAIEGVHKYYDYLYDVAVADLVDANPKAEEDKLRGRAYGVAHAEMRSFIRLGSQSTVPYFVMTAWAGREKDNKEDNKSPSHLWPDFPGAMAQNILGEFGAVLFAKAGQEVGPSKFSAGTWQTRPGGQVWGASLKLPKEIAPKIPTIVPQDWRALEARVMKEWADYQASLTTTK